MPLIMVLLVVFFSIIVVRIGTIALKMTGLSRDIAAFQAQSAFSGVGFTTSESEYVVSHPVRRKIIRILMLLGSAGITTTMASLVLTFVGQTPEEMMIRGMWLAVGLFGLYLFSRSKLVDRGLSWVIEKALEKFTNLKLYDYEQLLGLSRGYAIAQFRVREHSWLHGKKLRELRLADEGVLVLGIYRKLDDKEVFIGAPRGDTVILENDVLICYGHEETLRNLTKRLRGPQGDKEHIEAVKKEETRKKEVEEEIKKITETNK
ncbi:TrkA C-terminal domain-containing protein [Desulfurococcaceae archaeon MEX13E-LK6-19]|nr:TrkA C-terminal domain-containing protein [Desulfurococcaceae archaeon MEX13E-LK6-19]